MKKHYLIPLILATLALGLLFSCTPARQVAQTNSSAPVYLKTTSQLKTTLPRSAEEAPVEELLEETQPVVKKNPITAPRENEAVVSTPTPQKQEIKEEQEVKTIFEPEVIAHHVEAEVKAEVEVEAEAEVEEEAEEEKESQPIPPAIKPTPVHETSVPPTQSQEAAHEEIAELETKVGDTEAELRELMNRVNRLLDAQKAYKEEFSMELDGESGPKMEEKEEITASQEISIEELPEDPNDFMRQLMAQGIDVEGVEMVAESDIPARGQTSAKNELSPTELVVVAVSMDQSVTLDEPLLIKWENAIRAMRRGEEPQDKLPTWILQGLEWLTHTQANDPYRSHRLMPLYKHLEYSGHLDDVNENQMTPIQVVEKMRLLVNEMKTSKSQIKRG